MLQANFIDPINTQYALFTRIQRIHCYITVTVHNLYHFEKVEWNNLVRAEEKAEK